MAIRPSAMEDVVRLPAPQFWHGKRVLLTGHTGFKGSWLALWLHRLGAQVTGFSLPPNTQPNLYSLAGIADVTDSRFGDIRDAENLAALVRQVAPEIVLHLAAQPLVRASYLQPLETFATNVMGAANLLESLRGLNSLKAAVFVTTDKVYRDRKWPYPYRENDALGGHDPYSASKAAAEIVTASYRDAFLAGQGVAVATARAGNVIGGGDWSQDRLIPDAIRAWESGRSLEIRRPEAIRPWQHVLDPLAGYLILAEQLWSRPELAGAYNLGPETGTTATVREVIEYARKNYGHGQVIWGNGNDGPHEAGWLGLEIAKSRATLGIAPRWSLFNAIGRTMSWYSRLAQGAEAHELCISEISEFEDMP